MTALKQFQKYILPWSSKPEKEINTRVCGAGKFALYGPMGCVMTEREIKYLEKYLDCL